MEIVQVPEFVPNPMYIETVQKYKVCGGNHWIIIGLFIMSTYMVINNFQVAIGHNLSRQYN